MPGRSRSAEVGRGQAIVRRDTRMLVEDALALGRHCAMLPILDERSDEEILGYEDHRA